MCYPDVNSKRWWRSRPLAGVYLSLTKWGHGTSLVALLLPQALPPDSVFNFFKRQWVVCQVAHKWNRGTVAVPTTASCYGSYSDNIDCGVAQNVTSWTLLRCASYQRHALPKGHHILLVITMDCFAKRCHKKLIHSFCLFLFSWNCHFIQESLIRDISVSTFIDVVHIFDIADKYWNVYILIAGMTNMCETCLWHKMSAWLEHVSMKFLENNFHLNDLCELLHQSPKNFYQYPH